MFCSFLSVREMRGPVTVGSESMPCRHEQISEVINDSEEDMDAVVH